LTLSSIIYIVQPEIFAIYR